MSLPVYDVSEVDIDAEVAELLERLPPFEAGAYEIVAAVTVIAREFARIRLTAERIQANFVPATADELLGWWETVLGLPVLADDPSLLTQRRATIAGALEALYGIGSGASWVDALTALIGSGWSYEEHREPS